MMEWPIQTAEKELFTSFTNIICEKSILWNKYKLVIWGASVRGMIFGRLLKEAGYDSFEYVDNDAQKWGNNICGHTILSPDIVRAEILNRYIIVSIEYGNEIRTQLLGWGLEEERNFIVLSTSIYEKYIKEFFQDKFDKLILGESFLNEIILGEKAISLKEKIWECFGRESTKILAMNCMGMQGFYHILRLQLKLKKKPAQFWMFVNYETLTEHHHFLPRAQHPELFKLIKKEQSIEDTELDNFIILAEERSHNYKLEAEYSPKRNTSDECSNINTVKEYLKQGLMYNVSVDSKEFVYFKKILQLLRINKIESYIIMTPVNYQLAIQYYGQSFIDIYQNNNMIMKKAIEQMNAEFVDFGHLVEAKEFSSSVTINDGISYKAMEAIVWELQKIGKKMKKK